MKIIIYINNKAYIKYYYVYNNITTTFQISNFNFNESKYLLKQHRQYKRKIFKISNMFLRNCKKTIDTICIYNLKKC